MLDTITTRRILIELRPVPIHELHASADTHL